MSQYDDYIRDYDAVAVGSKPAVIVESRKSARAYDYVRHAAHWERLPNVACSLKGSDGVARPAVIVAESGKTISAIVALLNRRGDYERDAFQITLGSLLGYSIEDCVDFTATRVSRNCGCELCGGTTPESRLDDEARTRRTMFHA